MGVSYLHVLYIPIYFIYYKIKGGKQPNTRQGFKQVSQNFPKEASTWVSSFSKTIVAFLLTRVL